MMEQTIDRISINFQSAVRRTLSPAAMLALMILCGLLLAGITAQAQETRPAEPASDIQQQSGKPKAEDKDAEPPVNGLLQANEQAPQPNLAVTDGEIVFTSPGVAPYPRDIRLSDNLGGLRFYGTNSLTTSPTGAAIQFFGNNAAGFGGRLFLDSGATNNGALIFRTAETGETITERMRVRSDGNVGVGTSGSSTARLRVVTTTGGPQHAFRGETQNADGIAVEGISPNGGGVVGTTTSGVGVQGESGPNGLAGRFLGNVAVNGTLFKGGGSFKIDHPLDPANKYLSHSFVESPDMMNIYNGVATTDAKGEAVVTMPAYFTALNSDHRYQLTVIGQFAQAIVSSEIKDNRFTIKTDKPEVKVSWQVTGVRQDAFAKTHRIRVEEEKTGAERGAYLHPEAFGQPAAKGIGAAPKIGATVEGETKGNR